MSPGLLRELAAVLLKAAAEAESAPIAPPADERLDARAAARFGVTVRQFRRAIKAGALPAERAGRRLLVLRSDLEAFAKSRRVTPRPPEPSSQPAPSEIPGAAAFEKLQRDGRLGKPGDVLEGGRLRSIPGGKGKGPK